MPNHHGRGYKELFSHPEFVQQLLTGFAPPELARHLDFSTLALQSGNYITPLSNETFEDLVWSVKLRLALMALLVPSSLTTLPAVILEPRSGSRIQ